MTSVFFVYGLSNLSEHFKILTKKTILKFIKNKIEIIGIKMPYSLNVIRLKNPYRNVKNILYQWLIRLTIQSIKKN